MTRSMASVLVAGLVLGSGGCAAPSASDMFRPLSGEAESISGFPAVVGELERVRWEHDQRSVTAHYRARGGGSAWITRFVCEPGEQDPLAYIRPRRLMRGVVAGGSGARLGSEEKSNLGGYSITLLRIVAGEEPVAGEEERATGTILAAVTGPEGGMYHVLIARAMAGDGAPPDIGPLMLAALAR